MLMVIFIKVNGRIIYKMILMTNKVLYTFIINVYDYNINDNSNSHPTTLYFNTSQQSPYPLVIVLIHIQQVDDQSKHLHWERWILGVQLVID
jgi:hypothetical protein